LRKVRKKKDWGILRNEEIRDF